MEPRFHRAHLILGHVALDRGHFEEAFGEFRRAVDLADRSAEAVAALARAHARTGDERAVASLLSELAEKPYLSPYTLATVHAARGAAGLDTALSLLGDAYREGVAALPYIGVDPRLSSLKGDARFDALLHDVGLR